MQLFNWAHDKRGATSRKMRSLIESSLSIALSCVALLAAGCSSDVNSSSTKTYDNQYVKTIAKAAIVSVVYSDVIYFGGRIATVTDVVKPKSPEVLLAVGEHTQNLLAYLAETPLPVTLVQNAPQSEVYKKLEIKGEDSMGVSSHRLGISCLSGYKALPENDAALYASLCKQLEVDAIMTVRICYEVNPKPRLPNLQDLKNFPKLYAGLPVEEAVECYLRMRTETAFYGRSGKRVWEYSRVQDSSSIIGTKTSVAGLVSLRSGISVPIPAFHAAAIEVSAAHFPDLVRQMTIVFGK